MNIFAKRRALQRAAFVLGTLLAGCSDSGRYATAPGESTPYAASMSVSLGESAIEVGQETQAIVTFRDQFGAPFFVTESYPVFTSTNPDIAGVAPIDGRIVGSGQGTTAIVASYGDLRATRTLSVAYPVVFINEVLPLSDSNTGWVELFNPTGLPIDLSGWMVLNNPDTTRGVLPSGTSIPAHGYLAVEESVFPTGLGAKGLIRLLSKFGVQSDAFAWGHDPIHSYGRCPDGESGLGETSQATKGASNACEFLDIASLPRTGDVLVKRQSGAIATFRARGATGVGGYMSSAASTRCSPLDRQTVSLRIRCAAE